MPDSSDDSIATDFSDDRLIRDAYAIETPDDARDFYQRWAGDYDEHMVDELGYISPILVARLLLAHLPERDVEVLDIGCGTGLTARPLAEQGIARIDGVDLSDDMLEQARATGIYRRLVRADLTQPLELPEASWDALISSGTFTHGHIGPAPLEALFGLLRPGGLFAFTVHRDVWDEAGFEAEMARLECEGIATTVERRLDRFYEGQPPVGWFLVSRRL